MRWSPFKIYPAHSVNSLRIVDETLMRKYNVSTAGDCLVAPLFVNVKRPTRGNLK